MLAGGSEGTGVPDRAACCGFVLPWLLAFGLGAHPKLRERAGVDGLVRVSQERRESKLGFAVGIYRAGKKPQTPQ